MERFFFGLQFTSLHYNCIEVLESWAAGEWFTTRPDVPKKITVTVFKVASSAASRPLFRLKLRGREPGQQRGPPSQIGREVSRMEAGG